MKKIVIFTGAGVSAESGISTFRDAGGLWDNYKIEEVATVDAFRKNPSLVLDFYNQRRRAIKNVKPNIAHYSLVELEKYYQVEVITQNIDDLHERAGSSNVLHLHGLITEARDKNDAFTLYDIGYSDIQVGDLSPQGNQLRPNVVWFGESVPMMEKAIPIVNKCDIFIVIGTSLNVYPAANLAHFTHSHTQKYIVDLHLTEKDIPADFVLMKINAAEGVAILVHELIQNVKI